MEIEETHMYVKLTEGVLEIAPLNKKIDGNIIFNYNIDEIRLTSDGYKLLVETAKPSDNQVYSLSYTETEDKITQVWNLEKVSESLKIYAGNSLKETRLSYQSKPLSVEVVRDKTDEPNLVLSLDSSLDTRGNVEACFSICKDKGEVYFYDKEGKGDWLTENELSQVRDKVMNSIDLSFYITGRGLSEIASCSESPTLRDEIDTLINKYKNIFEELYSKVTGNVSYDEIKKFITNN